MVKILILLSGLCYSCSLILYGSQGSRSPLVNWYLHELDVPFTMGNRIDNPHPFGQIPCIKDGETVVFESGAILMYIADKYDQEQLNTPEKRSAVCAWLVWANSSLDPILFKENERGQVIGTGAGVENKKLRTLDNILSKSKFLLGDDFSVADVAVASYLLYIPQFFGRSINFNRYPCIASYMLTCCKRPSYRKAYPSEFDQIIDICESFQ